MLFKFKAFQFSLIMVTAIQLLIKIAAKRASRANVLTREGTGGCVSMVTLLSAVTIFIQDI